MAQVLDLLDHVLLQVKHAQMSQLLETFNAQDAVVLEPEGLEAPVLVERLDLLVALEVKVERIVEVRRVKLTVRVAKVLQVALREDGLAGLGVTIHIDRSDAILVSA